MNITYATAEHNDISDEEVVAFEEGHEHGEGAGYHQGHIVHHEGVHPGVVGEEAG